MQVAPAPARDSSMPKGTHGESAQKPNILKRAWNGYEAALGGFVGHISAFYGNLGARIANKPGTTIIISLVISALILIGFARFKLETESDVLWVPQKGKSQDDRKYVQATYPRSKDGASFYAQLNPKRIAEFGDDNAVRMPVTWEMFQLHNKVMALTVTGDNGQPATYQDLCYRNRDGTCNNANGYLWYWSKDFSNYLSSVQGSAADPMAGNATAFRQQVSETVYPDGQPVSLLSVFGGTTFSFNPFQLQSAKVIASDYTLDNTVSDDVAKDWHLKFIDLMQEELPKQQYMTFTWITGSSVGEELGKAINNDMFLVIISLLIFIVIAILFLSKPNAVRTRTTLAIAGIFVTGLGIAVGWGWGLIFGMPFTPLQQLSPFILLGMGVDVVLVLVKSYEIIMQREPWLTLPEAFSKLMSTSGLSVQITLLASAVAFALGSVDDLNSVKWFAAFATLNTVMILVLMMTTFIALMVYTERRILSGRLDCLCCIKRPSAALPPAAMAASGSSTTQACITTTTAPEPHKTISLISSASDDNNSHEPRRVALTDDEVQNESIVKKFFRKYYAPALAKWWVKLPVFLIFVGLGAASWYGIYQVKYGQPLSDLAPDGSYLQDYDRVQKETFQQQVGEPVNLYFRNMDFASTDVQYKMYRALDLALQNEFVNASTSAFLGNWLISFTTWAQDKGETVALPVNNCYNPYVGKVVGNLAGVITPAAITGCVPQDKFYTLLSQWLAARGSSNSLILQNGVIVAHRLSIMQTASANNDKYGSDLMHSIRDLEKDINGQLFSQEEDKAGTYPSFIYGGSYVFNEGEQILPNSALLYFMLALVGVGVVCLVMLVNPLASLLLMCAVGLVVLYLFGELWALDIKFNQVSIINMVMATGLSTDYSVYFAQRFMTVTADGTGNGRMQQALADTGSAVFLGGFTALCGTVPMAFSKSVIIRTFFRLIFGTIILSLAVGLILMPIVFSTLALPPVRSALVDGQQRKPQQQGAGTEQVQQQQLQLANSAHAAGDV